MLRKGIRICLLVMGISKNMLFWGMRKLFVQGIRNNIDIGVRSLFESLECECLRIKCKCKYKEFSDESLDNLLLLELNNFSDFNLGFDLDINFDFFSIIEKGFKVFKKIIKYIVKYVN